jgi:Protein of unknown function (DUF3455)
MTAQYRSIRNIYQAPLFGLLAACAASPPAQTTDIPASLQVPAADVSARHTRGAGVQIYECRANKDDAARFEWQLKAPEADIRDPAGKKIGKHYAGPSWEATDGSKVTGELVARVNSTDPDAVAWLLLRAKTTSGDGIFGRVQFIQRLHTAGGNAPSGGCNQASVGSEVRVPYSADYWFYSAKP